VQTGSGLYDECLWSLSGFAKEKTIIKLCVLEMERVASNSAASIYWAPPSARFVTISARCDGLGRRRAITQFALVPGRAKVFLSALHKVVAPIRWRQDG
jgi:hypothetical protein